MTEAIMIYYERKESITQVQFCVTIMCRNELDDELSWLFTNILSATW